MEDTFISFSRSLPAATLLMLLVLLATGSKTSAVRRHQWLGWGLALACLIPFVEPQLPQWRILPRVGDWTAPLAPSTALPWFLILAAIWMLGAALLIARAGAGVLLLHWHQRAAIPVDEVEMTEAIERCRRRTGLARAPEVFWQPSYAMPMTWGWFRPRIWLPLSAEDWSVDELDCVLLHEMAHIERRDYPTELLNRLCLAVYWFHPVAWLLSRRMELAREMACDDRVLLSGKKASSYAESLAHIGAGLPIALPETAAGFLGRKPLLARLIGIADPWRSRSRLTGEDVWATAAPLTLVALFVCSLGFKAVAEVHEDKTLERAATMPRVVSVWDDFIQPTVEALIIPESPPERRLAAIIPSPVVAATEVSPASAASVDQPAPPALLQSPVREATIRSPLASDYDPIEQPMLAGFRRPSLQSFPSPVVNSAPDSKAVEAPSQTRDATSANASKPTEKASKSSKSQPQRELSAALTSEDGSRRLRIDFLVAKGTATKLLQAESTTDFKNWQPVSATMSVESADIESDRLRLHVAAASGMGFVRIREIEAKLPIPDKISPGKPAIKEASPPSFVPSSKKGAGTR